MATPDTGAWTMADRLADHALADIILARRSEGASWARIAGDLHADHGIVITPMTVADWHRQLTDDDEQAEVAQ